MMYKDVPEHIKEEAINCARSVMGMDDEAFIAGYLASALYQARSQAFEECAKIVEDCNMWDDRREIAQAIRQNVGEK